MELRGIGQNRWGENYLRGYSMLSAIVTEVVSTFIFMIAILGASLNHDSKELPGLSIGLTLCAIILCFINVTGVSLNPARSFGPAIFVGGTAVTQLWLFVVAPVVGAVLAGFFYSKPSA